MRLIVTVCLILASVITLAGQNPGGNSSAASRAEPWRTSWTQFAQATKAYLDQELATHPEKPEFPAGGRNMLSVGEPTPPDLPVMKRFNGPVVFEGKLVAVNTKAEDLMKGQPFKLEFEMTEPGVAGWLIKPTHVYPVASDTEKWRAIPLGTVVKFKSQITGLSAFGMSGKYFCLVLLTKAELLQPK